MLPKMCSGDRTGSCMPLQHFQLNILIKVSKKCKGMALAYWLKSLETTGLNDWLDRNGSISAPVWDREDLERHLGTKGTYICAQHLL